MHVYVVAMCLVYRLLALQERSKAVYQKVGGGHSYNACKVHMAV